MNTYAIQILLHYQASTEQESRFDKFLEELKPLADRHGISFDDFQSFGLPGSDYKICPCKLCGHLTVDRDDVHDAIENMLPDFWFYVRRGRLFQSELVCDLCGPSATIAQPSVPADA
jgi:hypothetical protein